MNYRAMFVLVIISVFFGWCGNAQFVEKRSKKGPSMVALKEQCCKELGEVLNLVPEILRRVATLQEKSIAAIRGYWQSDSASFCNVASREQLALCKAKLESVHALITALCQEADACINALQTA